MNKIILMFVFLVCINSVYSAITDFDSLDRFNENITELEHPVGVSWGALGNPTNVNKSVYIDAEGDGLCVNWTETSSNYTIAGIFNISKVTGTDGAFLTTWSGASCSGTFGTPIHLAVGALPTEDDWSWYDGSAWHKMADATADHCYKFTVFVDVDSRNVNYTMNYCNDTFINSSGFVDGASDLVPLSIRFVFNNEAGDGIILKADDFMVYNGTVQPTIDVDTCTAPGSGDWEVDCSDNCLWSTAQDVPGDIIMRGSGRLQLSDFLRFTGSGQEIAVNSGCTFEVISGGGW